MAGKGWAMTGDSLTALAVRVGELRPPLVVECGSGRSTRVLREAVLPWAGHVLSLENVEDCWRATRNDCDGLPGDVRFAPLVERDSPAGRFPFYDVTLPNDIEFALIDGPQQKVYGRQGTLPALWPHLTSGAVVWMDDTNRAAEQAMIAMWSDHYAFTVTQVDEYVCELRKA